MQDKSYYPRIDIIPPGTWTSKGTNNSGDGISILNQMAKEVMLVLLAGASKSPLNNAIAYDELAECAYERTDSMILRSKVPGAKV